MAGFSGLSMKVKNGIIAGGLAAFVIGVYAYTMKAVGGTDEIQVAINKFEEEKSMKEGSTKA